MKLQQILQLSSAHPRKSIRLLLPSWRQKGLSNQTERHKNINSINNKISEKARGTNGFSRYLKSSAHMEHSKCCELTVTRQETPLQMCLHINYVQPPFGVVIFRPGTFFTSCTTKQIARNSLEFCAYNATRQPAVIMF